MSLEFSWNQDVKHRRQAQKEDLLDVLEALGGGRLDAKTPVTVVRALLRGRVETVRAQIFPPPCSAQSEERYEADPLNASPSYG